MMSEHNWIYRQDGKRVGHFLHGVAWSAPEGNRLGEYDEEFIYDNNFRVIAKVNNCVVMNIIGEEIGMIAEDEIFVSDKVVGSFIGDGAAAAASIALIFNVEGTRGV